ncbi:MAG: hypothetical protein JST00_05945 [Deltaproteobacteria bacterium]|nr:hypothetical protein [Deltaproteobacteria bacterium]
MTASALFRTALTSAFILLMLASAHLFMVVINAAEMRFAAPRPESGQVARMFSDRPRTEELEAAIRKAKNPEKRHVLEAALAAEQSGKPVELRTLPVTKFLVWATLGLTAAGTVLIWLTSRLKGDTAQTIVGIFGGNLIWTGGVEYGLTIAARSLGVGKAIGVVDGQAVAIYGEYVLLKHTWGFLALIAVYLLFLESSRCPVFLWWRKKVPTMRGPVVTGRIDNYGPRSGFQYATTVWGFYLLLLWAYDEQVFGVYSYVTKAIMLFSIAGSLYCARRLYQQTGWGPALRYAIAAMIVVWTPIEIAGKWGIFNEPWLLLRPEALFVFFGGLSFGTWTLWRAQRRRLLALAEASTAQASSAAVTAVGPGGSMGGMGGMSGSMGGMGGSMGSVGSMAAARVASAEANPARCPFSLGKPSDSMAMKEAPSRAVA